MYFHTSYKISSAQNQKLSNKYFTISLWFLRDALWSGEEPVGFGAFGFSTWGAKNLKISVFPSKAAIWSGVHPEGAGALGFSTWGA